MARKIYHVIGDDGKRMKSLHSAGGPKGAALKEGNILGFGTHKIKIRNPKIKTRKVHVFEVKVTKIDPPMEVKRGDVTFKVTKTATAKCLSIER